jgi:hypothetical protein
MIRPLACVGGIFCANIPNWLYSLVAHDWWSHTAMTAAICCNEMRCLQQSATGWDAGSSERDKSSAVAAL